MKENSIKQKAVKGVGWSAIDNVSGYAVTFVVGIILARLLSPEDYGLIGLTGIFSAICVTFIDAGFSNALVRKKDVTNEDYCTVFLTNISVSIVLYFLIFAFAPYIAEFFKRQELLRLIRISSLGLIIGALSLVQRTQINKRIDFKTQAKITIISLIVRGTIGVSTAFAGFGVWALVSQDLAGSLVTTILLWYYNRWIPKMAFSPKSFHDLFGFSYKLLLSGLIDTIWEQIYNVVIGKCYAPSTLGQYSRATNFSSLLSSNLTNIIQRVSYPVLSEIQDDKVRLKDAYQRMIKTTMLITFPSMLLLSAVSKPMIIMLIGLKWMQAAYFLQIICLNSMLYPLHAMNLNMLKVQGRSDLFLKLEILKKMVAVGPLLIGVFIDIYWMLVGSVLTGFIAYYLNAYYSGPLLGYSIREQIKDIMPSFLIASFSAFLAYCPSFVYDCFWNGTNWEQIAFVLFPLQSFLGVIVFLFICERIKTSEYIELKEIVFCFSKKSRQ